MSRFTYKAILIYLFFASVIAICTSVLAIGNDPFSIRPFYTLPAFVAVVVTIPCLLTAFILIRFVHEKNH